MSSKEAAARIRSALSMLPRDSLRFFGEWFGGRRDAFHTIVGATTEEDALVIHFDEGETLTVWSPTGVTATPAMFRIEDAARLRWEWFYYGRPRTPENLQWIEYVRRPDGRVSVADPYEPDMVHRPDEAAPAVEMTTT